MTIRLLTYGEYEANAKKDPQWRSYVERWPYHAKAIEIIRGCQGLDLIGCDLVEVSPPYDTTGNTSLLGANLLYEMLCVLPGVTHR